MIHLVITTWRGFDPTATHYYGYLLPDLTFDHPHIRLERKLTSSEAAKINKARRLACPGEKFPLVWKAGDMYDGWDDKETLIDYAIKVYRKHFPDQNMLVLGDPIFGQYEKVLHHAIHRNI